MILLITGAGGFLGQHVVAAAVRKGHTVRALMRPASGDGPASWAGHPQVQIVRGDLRARDGHQALVAGVDVVVHLAAAKAGGLYDQFAGTVVATENLLGAMDAAGAARIVTTSSFSVYEYLNRWSFGLLDESSALADPPEGRDEYCQTKLIQETLVREFASERGWHSVVLRPGVIFGRDNSWTARLGLKLGERLWVRTGLLAPLPLTYVENCADAIVLGAEYEGDERDLVLNVVDDKTPSKWSYLNAMRRYLTPVPRTIPLPWFVFRVLARSAWLTNRLCFGGTGKVPAILKPAALHARCKHLRFSNAKAKTVLGWRPRYDWREGLERSFAAEHTATLPAPGVAVAARSEQPA